MLVSISTSVPTPDLHPSVHNSASSRGELKFVSGLSSGGVWVQQRAHACKHAHSSWLCSVSETPLLLISICFIYQMIVESQCLRQCFTILLLWGRDLELQQVCKMRRCNFVNKELRKMTAFKTLVSTLAPWWLFLLE